MSVASNRWEPGVHPLQLSGFDSGGLLKRWENIRHPVSQKKMVVCAASTPEYRRGNYLKITEQPSGATLSYMPRPDLRETRFHRGFHRRHYTDIGQDIERLKLEDVRGRRGEAAAKASAEATRLEAQRCPFNVLTGEGGGRDEDFRGLGKAILNPTQSMPSIFVEHHRDEINRMRASKHRFFEPFKPSPSSHRAKQLHTEGFTITQRESMILGRVPGRHRLKSIGADDNFRHKQAR
ncbi:hypothetical protein FOZ63_033963 [Perkinsus olseni]|uniref:Uncharacterized protein n=1 Tax=Perkinsus olseni TaxID=32597 RepID=A0A7J6RF64_PEROL|nr:hypothetical protein FOZ63_033963 [Perkinsus olseni]KAF4718686.1 hypothetical protein FOZ62_020118 [Perkinsus olseni]